MNFGTIHDSHKCILTLNSGPGLARHKEYRGPLLREPGISKCPKDTGPRRLPVAIRMKVMEDGKIELFDFEDESWSKHENVQKALSAATKILRREVNLRLKSQPIECSQRTIKTSIKES
jgi:hypothetical protein